MFSIRASPSDDDGGDGDVHHALCHLLVQSGLDLFLGLALELALGGVRVEPVLHGRLLRQHDASGHGSGYGHHGHQAGEDMLGHAEYLSGFLGRLDGGVRCS